MKIYPMHDLIFVGFLAGLVGGITVNLVTLPLFYLGFTKFALLHVGVGIILQETRLDTGALILGFMAHLAVSTALGILLVYLLVRTGRDFCLLKGLVVSLLFWVALYGIAGPVLLPEGFPKLDLVTTAVEFVGLAVAGALAAYFIATFTEPHLFAVDELK